MINENCKGCRSYEYNHSDCELTNVEGICPCSVCLVKGMCEMGCEEYEEYYNSYHEDQNHG